MLVGRNGGDLFILEISSSASAACFGAEEIRAAVGTHLTCSAQHGLHAFPSTFENPEADSSQTQLGRCAIPFPGIPPPLLWV